jgi:hypothetical protein
MKAFLDDFDNLHLVVDTETPEELQSYSSLKECLSVCLGKLEVVDPEDIGARTEAPIFRAGQAYWTYSAYLENPPMESLRDTGVLVLEKV